MPAVNVLMKPASGMCNMSCDYCFYCDETSKRKCSSYGFMTERTLRNVIRRTILRAEGAVSYAFQGGEPTLRGLDFFKRAITYERQYNKNHIYVMNALQTNGYAIDEDWCSFFIENNFLIGLSVDGTRETHDCLRHTKRGEPTYAKVLHAADLFDQYQVKYNILTVVTPQIVENINEIYEEYQSRGWYYQQYIACLDPLGEGHGKTSYSISPYQYGRFLTDLFEMWYQDWKRGRKIYIRQFENYVGIAAGYVPEACDQRGICSIQNVVEADGSVYPCDFYALDEYYLGNFNTDSLEVINENRKKIGFQERSFLLKTECLHCQFYRLCRGGCQRNRDYNIAEGKFENYFCEGYRMFFEACEKKINEMAKTIG